MAVSNSHLTIHQQPRMNLSTETLKHFDQLDQFLRKQKIVGESKSHNLSLKVPGSNFFKQFGKVIIETIAKFLLFHELQTITSVSKELQQQFSLGWKALFAREYSSLKIRPEISSSLNNLPPTSIKSLYRFKGQGISYLTSLQLIKQVKKKSDQEGLVQNIRDSTIEPTLKKLLFLSILHSKEELILWYLTQKGPIQIIDVLSRQSLSQFSGENVVDATFLSNDAFYVRLEKSIIFYKHDGKGGNEAWCSQGLLKYDECRLAYSSPDSQDIEISSSSKANPLKDCKVELSGDKSVILVLFYASWKILKFDRISYKFVGSISLLPQNLLSESQIVQYKLLTPIHCVVDSNLKLYQIQTQDPEKRISDDGKLLYSSPEATEAVLTEGLALFQEARRITCISLRNESPAIWKLPLDSPSWKELGERPLAFCVIDRFYLECRPYQDRENMAMIRIFDLQVNSYLEGSETQYRCNSYIPHISMHIGHAGQMIFIIEIDAQSEEVFVTLLPLAYLYLCLKLDVDGPINYLQALLSGEVPEALEGNKNLSIRFSCSLPKGEKTLLTYSYNESTGILILKFKQSSMTVFVNWAVRKLSTRALDDFHHIEKPSYNFDAYKMISAFEDQGKQKKTSMPEPNVFNPTKMLQSLGLPDDLMKELEGELGGLSDFSNNKTTGSNKTKRAQLSKDI